MHWANLSPWATCSHSLIFPLKYRRILFTLRLILLSVTYFQILTTPPHILSNPFRSLAHSILLTASLGTHAASRRHGTSLCVTHTQLSPFPKSIFHAKFGKYTQTWLQCSRNIGFLSRQTNVHVVWGRVKPWIFVYPSWKMESLSQEGRFKRSGTLTAGKQRLRRDTVALYKNIRGVNTREELSMLKDNIGMRTTDNKLAMNKCRQWSMGRFVAVEGEKLWDCFLKGALEQKQCWFGVEHCSGEITQPGVGDCTPSSCTHWAMWAPSCILLH